MTDRVPESARRDIEGEQYLHEDAVRKLMGEVVVETFQRQWRKWVLGPFVLMFLLVAASIAWTQHLDSGNDKDTKGEGARATYTGCVDRAEARFVVAAGFDKLRRLAIPADQVKTAEQQARVDGFLDSTQPAIDALLSDAVNRAVVTSGVDPKHPDRGRGEINESVIEPLRMEVRQSCIRQASRFGVDLGKLGLNGPQQRQNGP